MKTAAFLGSGFTGDAVFDSTNPRNRDNSFDPFIKLKNCLHHAGYDLHTKDVCKNRSLDFELHCNVRPVNPSIPAYLILFETSLIYPENGISHRWAAYRKVFTWNDELVDNKKFIKICFPNPITVPVVDGFAARPQFCCLIAGNKSVETPDKRELYSERVRAIRWFEQNAAQDFALYGIGWDMPARRTGWGRNLTKKMWKLLSRFTTLNPFPSYRGTVEHKRDVLIKTRFCICYENVCDMPGYITEKIFDCFFSGCVPVYWGPNNIDHYIPANCYIDRRKFSNTAETYAFLKSITEAEFQNYQKNIIHFLQSDAVKVFSSESFAEIITNTIVQDLGRLA